MSSKMEKDIGVAMLRQQIDESLRHVYQETVDQDIPDRFLVLLDRLRKKGGEQ